MDKLVSIACLGLVITLGCGENISVEDTDFTDHDIHNKNAGFNIVSDAFCSPPCTVMVAGLPNQLVQGVRYIVNGAELDINGNWWMGYAQTLPSTAVGHVSVQAELVDLFGFVIASTEASVIIPSGDSTQVQTRVASGGNSSVRLQNDGSCSTPCELRASITGAIDKVEFYAGPYYLGEAGGSSNYTINYEFNQTGLREIRAVGVTWGGTIKAEHRAVIEIIEQSSSGYSSSVSSGGYGQYNASIGNSIADAAYAIATRRNTVGYCYSAAADAIESVTGPFLWGGSAYLAADQLNSSSWFFEASVSDLRSLPAGAVVVWGKGSSPHGHISIALGNGKEASDHVANQMTYHYGGAPARVFYPQ